MRFGGALKVILALCCAASLPSMGTAACKSALPSESLRGLDDRVDIDPGAVNAEVRRRLDALRPYEALLAAQLYAISADAFDLLDDDEHARAVVAQGRDALQQVAEGDAQRVLQFRLDLIAADSPRNAGDMVSAVEKLTELEHALPARSLDRACLLIIRSRINSQLLRDDQATADGITAYRIAATLPSPSASADAAYQLAFTYLRAGLLEDARRSADEAAAYYEKTHRIARWATALYIKADILAQLRLYDSALSAITATRALNAQLHEEVDVGFDDQKACDILLAMTRLDAAEHACLSAEEVLAAAGRADLQAVIEGSLARIDLGRARPAAAIRRLDRVLRSPEQVPAKTLPRLYRSRSEALTRVGRNSDALRDLQQAWRLNEARDAEGGSAAAAGIKERLNTELINQEKFALEDQILRERQDAASRERLYRLRLALAAAAGLLCISIAYFMWSRARQERALRRAAETLEAQAQVISTVREGVMLIDPRGRIQYANPSLLRMVDRSREEVIGSALDRLGIASEHFRSAGEAAGGLPSGSSELHLRDAAGKTAIVLLTHSSVALRDEVLTICILQDVTDLRRLERAILSAESAERRQMSSEVHEGLAQDLAGIALLLGGVAGKTKSDRSCLEFVVAHINEAIARARRLAKGLSPVKIAGGSLRTALLQQLQEISTEQSIETVCSFDIDGLQLTAAQSDQLYHIAQECLRITTRAAGCRKITLDLRATAEALILVVRGDGHYPEAQGVDAERAEETIAYLARVLGGCAQVQELPEWGVSISVSFPAGALAAEAASAQAAHARGAPGESFISR